MQTTELASFLRHRREALQPEDVGLNRGPRRRATGLRREEVAELSGMSADYYARLERAAGPQPSEQMVAAIARGLRLSIVERDHLFVLAGHHPPSRSNRSGHVNPGLMRVLDRLDDTPAQIMNGVGETLVQTRMAVGLLGDQTRFTGPARSAVFRWFTDRSSRDIHPAIDHEHHGRNYTAQLRRMATQHGGNSDAGSIARRLIEVSPEFAEYWNDHQVGLTYSEEKRFIHPEVGTVDLFCQILLDPDQEQSLLVFTATPGSDSQDRMKLLSVIGHQTLTPR